MSYPVGFNPFKDVGGTYQIGEMTDSRESLNLPEMAVPEPPAITMDVADEDGVVDIADADFNFNMDFNKKFPQQ